MLTKQQQLLKLEENIKTCTKCDLCKTALNAVPGEGNCNAEVVFIGEAPGATEDTLGRPFVGRAGKLLDQMLLEINLKREDVWIGNVIKHRPPKNRDPLPAEIAACEPFLTLQLKIIQPKLIVTLGRFAMYHFYKQGQISNDRGKLIKTDLYNIYPVYHPAAALRNSKFAAQLKQDILQIPLLLKTISF